MKLMGVAGVLLCLASSALAGFRAGPPAKAPGAKVEAVKADGLVLKATAEFWEDRMPMMPAPKTPDDNAGRFHATVKLGAANEGRKAVPGLAVSEIIVYYGGTTREFCRIKPGPVGETHRSASVAPGNQVALEYSGMPEKIGALTDSMMVYGQVLVTYSKGKRTSVLTPEAKVTITY
jgi:hypothetical protein